MSENAESPLKSKASLLLNRPTEGAYIEEWTRLLAASRTETPIQNNLSLVVFRLGKEWMALSTLVFLEITENKLVRGIPHRMGDVLKGLINLRGQLCLCVDLPKLLEIEPYKESSAHSQRVVAIGLNKQRWVFLTDEILGIFSCDMDSLKNIPVTVAKSTANYFKGTVVLEGRHVSVLDEELLFYSLEKRMA